MSRRKKGEREEMLQEPGTSTCVLQPESSWVVSASVNEVNTF